jgi:hypothetical protein
MVQRAFQVITSNKVAQPGQHRARLLRPRRLDDALALGKPL